MSRAPTLAEAVDRAGRRLGRATQPIVAGRFWALRASLFVSTISILLQSPPLELQRAFFSLVEAQGQDPLTPMDVDPASHQGKLAFRLFPPLLIRLLHLSPASYYAVQVLLGVVTLAGLAWLFHSWGYSRHESLALITALGFTYVGAVWFLDVLPYFDALAASTLVLAMASRASWLAFLGVFLAAWTDERAIVAAGVVIVFHLSYRQRGAAFAAVTALVAYAGLRALMTTRYGLGTPSDGAGLPVLRTYFDTTTLAVVLALEGLWVVVVAGFGSAMLRRGRLAWLGAACVIVSTITAMLVADVTRSMVYLLPALVLAVRYLADERADDRKIVFSIATTACVVCPTAMVILNHVGAMPPLPIRLMR